MRQNTLMGQSPSPDNTPVPFKLSAGSDKFNKIQLINLMKSEDENENEGSKLKLITKHDNLTSHPSREMEFCEAPLYNL